MTALWKQREDLIDTNTLLILAWLAQLDDKGKTSVIASLLDTFVRLPELRIMHDHLQEQLAGGGAK